MKYGSICSGIEAASVAWAPLGWQAQWLSEIEPYPRAVLQKHFPDTPLYGDFTALDPASISPVDVLVGGTPCQSFARRGKGGGLDDPRGKLTLNFVDLAYGLAARSDRPLQWAVWENVPGVLTSRSSRGSDFGCILAAFVGADAYLDNGLGGWPDAGMVEGPRGRAAWRVLDAQHFGLPQRRSRVFLVYSPGAENDPAAVLFERKRSPGHCRQSDELRQDAFACGPEEGTGDGEGLGAAPISNAPEFPYFLAWNGFERQVTPVASTLTHGDDNGERGVMDIHGPRKFTLRERERLMGFPDDWTAVEWQGKPAWDAPIGQRIEATGNSMAVPVIRWIGERIEAAERERATAAAA